ncbi:hypothetical protein [Streptomyces microflavus]|uniref:hypothetical protein n=1 Tax=Streptomyces microflavus TaxID=1919 RepID=UPI003698A6F2
MSELLDARGVAIAPGDTVIYGFGVGRSVAMAEAVVLGDDCDCDDTFPDPCPKPSVSLTPSGRVRLRVVRRSYSDGEKPVVDVAPDRLVVLKTAKTTWGVGPFGGGTKVVALLPESPLPTQEEKARKKFQKAIARYSETESPDWWDDTLGDWHTFAAKQLEEQKRKLRALDEH